MIKGGRFMHSEDISRVLVVLATSIAVSVTVEVTGNGNYLWFLMIPVLIG